MNIGIFETEHFEGCYPIIKLFDDGQNNITVFTYPSCYRQFEFLFQKKITQYNWVVKTETQTKYNFIYRIYRETKKRKISLLYLNTISNNHIFYALLVLLLPKVRIIITLHDINSYFDIRPPFHLKKWVRYAGKRALINLVQEFNVVSLTMTDYLKSKLPLSKKVHCLPGAVFEEEKMENLAPAMLKPLHIVVPGTVDIRRRNYFIVFELLEKLPPDLFKITLLGGISNKFGGDIRAKCRLYTKTHNNLQYYENDIVDQPEFDKIMNECHLVFIPSTINTIVSDDMPEIYGQSISSGNLFDVIKHAKPFIVPDLLKVDPFLAPGCIRYTEISDIVLFLHDLVNEPAKYTFLLESARAASENYTIPAVRARNEQLFQ